MLMENKLDLIEVEYRDSTELKGHRFDWTCPICDDTVIFSLENIEDFIDSELQNPSNEFWKCMREDYHQSLLNGYVEVRDLNTKEVYKVKSDGSFIYFIDKNGEAIMV